MVPLIQMLTVEDFLENLASLPNEIRRNFELMRALDKEAADAASASLAQKIEDNSQAQNLVAKASSAVAATKAYQVLLSLGVIPVFFRIALFRLLA